MLEPELKSETIVQCPACDWSADLEDFDQVMVGANLQIHCPSCDANLGSRDHALKLAA